MTCSVLIAGAGPVGLTMAAELARFGVSVRIVEKAAERTDKSKALVVWSRTLELLDRAGCAAHFVEAGNKVSGVNFVAGEKKLGHVSIVPAASAYNYALMLPQSDTERILEEHLARLGVTVERQVELTEFLSELNGVAATVRHADGHEEKIDTQWLIGCDGAHSFVRHRLDLAFTGDTLKSDWMLADLHLSGYPFPDSELSIFLHEDGLLALFPIEPGRYRVIADGALSTGAHPVDPTLQDVQATIEKRGPSGITASDPVWLAAFRINERKVDRYRAGRIFVAGDAAHVHSPAGGQGMNTGMQDAFNLAWKLALVCEGRCPEGLLDTYSDERSPVGQNVLKDSGRLTEIAVVKNHSLQMVRNIVGHALLGLAPVQSAVINTMTEIAVGYPGSALNGPSTHFMSGPGAGQRFTPNPGEKPIGAGRTARFALASSASGAAARLAVEFPDLLDAEIRKPPDADGTWLVRPDGYVACVVKRDDFGALAAYLRKLTRMS